VRRYGDRISFVGMAGRGDEASIRDFVEGYGLEAMDTVVDESGDLWSRFGVLGQPAWVFVDDAGESDLYQTALPEDELERILDEMIAS
jgi:hypothetical protein